MNGLAGVHNNVYVRWIYHFLCQSITQGFFFFFFSSFGQYDNQNVKLGEEKELSNISQWLILGEKSLLLLRILIPSRPFFQKVRR